MPGGWAAHKGVVEAAYSVRRRLENTRALQEAVTARPGYGIVITGMYVTYFEQRTENIRCSRCLVVYAKYVYLN